MMGKLLLFAFVIMMMVSDTIFAQDEQKDFGISLHGFVKTDFFYDSRQTVSAREGHFLLYPSDKIEDPYGKDINKNMNFNILSVQTRLRGAITAPDAFGAKTSGVIEGAFFGHSNSDINGFRLRHAFVKLAWKTHSLIIGQYWNPMFVTGCFPGVVSFNTGVPFQPFSRNPQIRFTKALDDISATFTAYSERDFASTGPSGSSSQYLRNSGLPAINAQLAYHQGIVLTGFEVDYKKLRPQLSFNGFQTDESVTGLSFLAYFKYHSDPLTLKLEGVKGQNLYDMLMLGGYGVKENGAEKQTYQPLNITSVWSELIYKSSLEFGVFAGYTKNNGASDDFGSSIYARGANIDHVFRLAPRVVNNAGKFRSALEVEYTSAAYGLTQTNGKVGHTHTVSNLRILTAFYLFF